MDWPSVADQTVVGEQDQDVSDAQYTVFVEVAHAIDDSECCFVIDLPDLGGSRKLEGLGKRVHSMVQFEGE